MKKKLRKCLLCGISGMVMAAMLAGCGGDAGKNAGDAGKTAVSETGQSDNGETDNSKNDSSDKTVDDSKGAWVLRHDITDKEVLDAPSGATLFVDKLTLPIKIDDLMDYPLDGAGIDGLHPLSELMDSYTESSNYFSFLVYDKTGEEMCYLPDLNMGDEYSETKITIKQAVTDGNWQLGLSKVYYDTLGLTEDEYNTMYNENPDVEKEYLLLDMLYDEFGAPNYVGWWLGDDNNTNFSGSYDAAALIDEMRHPEKYSDDEITAFATYVGWQFADYAVVLRIDETSNSWSGETKASVSDMLIGYVPASYGTLEEVYGKNAVSDFMAAR